MYKKCIEKSREKLVKGHMYKKRMKNPGRSWQKDICIKSA